MTSRRTGIRLGLISLFAVTSSIAAQDASQRATIVAFRDSLAQARDSSSLLSLERRIVLQARERRSDAMLHLRLGYLSLRLGEVGGRQHFESAGSEFEWVTQLEPQWPHGWFGLGLAELGVGDAELSLVQGLQTMLGRDALTRSANAFARSAEVDPEFVDGLVELANTALRQRINTRIDVALIALRRAAPTSAAKRAEVMLARARVEREAGSLDSALAVISALVELQPQRGSVLLEQAKIRFAMNRIDGAEPWFRGAGSAEADAVTAYRADLALLMNDSVARAFDVATLPERVALLRQFWNLRDGDELHAAGERLREHYRRLDYARRNFRLITKNRQFDIAERYRSGQAEFDDRGIIYIRHGAPEDRASYSAPGIEANETWHYGRDGEDLLFHFVARQDVQDYRLVESLFDILSFQDVVRLRDGSDSLNRTERVIELVRSREGIHPAYSRLLAAGRGGSAQIQTAERSLGRRSIALGTRSDSWRLRFGASLDARVEKVAVGHDSSGTHLQIAYAVAGASLRGTAAGRALVYPVRARASVLDPAGRIVARIDTTRVFRTRAEVPAGEHLLGRFALRVPPGLYTVRVAIEVGDAGMVTSRDTIRVTAPNPPVIGISDLAVGARGVSLPWRTADGDTAWASPLGAYKRAEPLQLYYEVSGVGAGSAYRTDIQVIRPSGGSVFKRVLGGSGAAIKLGFDANHPGGVHRVRREVSLDQLKPGAYIIEVTVTARDGRKDVRRRAMTVVQ